MACSDPIQHAIARAYDRIGRDGAVAPDGLGFPTGGALARELGYPPAELARVPAPLLDAFVGAGAVAPLVDKAGPVADLGCGAGVDSWLLAGRGHPVVAVDPSAAMVARLAAAVRAGGPRGLEIVRARVPDLPLAAGRFAWAVLNGSANLVPDRPGLVAEVWRLLRPGGRLVAADLVATGPIPPELRALPEAWAWCLAGAAPGDAWRADLAAAGFVEVGVDTVEAIPPVARAVIRARKPGGRR